jgi:hypothetical protein
MKRPMVQTTLYAALLSMASVAMAQEFPTTPQPETYQQAVEFQKRKDAADAAQARKEAGLAAKPATRTAKAKTARKAGQADQSKKPAKTQE